VNVVNDSAGKIAKIFMTQNFKIKVKYSNWSSTPILRGGGRGGPGVAMAPPKFWVIYKICKNIHVLMCSPSGSGPCHIFPFPSMTRV